MASLPAEQQSRSGIYDFAELGPSHRAVVQRVEPGSRVLELGCATGYMTRVLLAKGCQVVAADIDAPAVERLSDTLATRLVLDFESGEDIASLDRHGPFDAVLLADVLEHLRAPEALLRRVAPLLKPGGSCLVSLPNVAFWRIRLSLLRGRWDYTDVGILDRTHLRFYTPRSARALASDAGYKLETLLPISESFPFGSLFTGRAAWFKFRLDGLLFRLWPGPFTYQMVIQICPQRP